MTNYLATLCLMFLFAADYIGIIVWLMRTEDTPNDTIRLTIRGLMVAVTVVAIHAALLTAFLSDPPPLNP